MKFGMIVCDFLGVCEDFFPFKMHKSPMWRLRYLGVITSCLGFDRLPHFIALFCCILLSCIRPCLHAFSFSGLQMTSFKHSFKWHCFFFVQANREKPRPQWSKSTRHNAHSTEEDRENIPPQKCVCSICGKGLEVPKNLPFSAGICILFWQNPSVAAPKYFSIWFSALFVLCQITGRIFRKC